MASDPFWSLLVSYTDQIETRYAIGNTGTMVAHSEYGRPDPERAALAGHMLPFRKWDHMLGWTADYLEEARLTDIEADLLMGLDAVRNRWRMSLLQRLLEARRRIRQHQRPERHRPVARLCDGRRVDRRGLHPALYGGSTFTSDHEHYVAIAGGAFTAASLPTPRPNCESTAMSRPTNS
jgi:hypothetical protein